MSKFEDEAMESPKGGLIDAKSVEMGMLLEKIDKMAEVQNPHPQQI